MKNLFCLLLIVWGLSVKSQNIPPATRLRVNTTLGASAASSLAELDPTQIQSFMATASVNCIFMLTLAQTQGIQQIQVKLGTTAGNGDLFQKVFAFDGPASLPDGTTYKRQGNVVYLGLGEFAGLASYYAEVRLQDDAGNWTAATTFHK